MTSVDEEAYELVPFQHPADGFYGYAEDGTPITEDDVQWSVDNAEAGFPGVAARQVGHPLEIGEEPAVVIQFRIDKAKLRRLDAKAKARKTTRSALLRDAVDRELVIA